MAEAVHHEAVERLLASLSPRGESLLSSFMFDKPGVPFFERSMCTDVFVNRRAYTQALLFIRQHGAPYLRAISISALWSMLTNFVTENFWYISRTTFPILTQEPYLSRVSPDDKMALAEALAASPMFHPTVELSLYPLVPIRVVDDFECARFFIVAAGHLNHLHLPAAASRVELEPLTYPPLSEWDGPKKTPNAWLGVRSPLPPVSDKLASAILGAMALTPLPRYRYMFSMRKMFGGKCRISGGFTVNGADSPHTPPMMEDIALTSSDHGWLGILYKTLEAQDMPSRSRVRALEYFYRSWFLDPRERFPALCMSLDSLVGASRGHTAAVVKFVQGTIRTPVDEQRLRLLMRVRGAVIHGAAPDVYDSKNYAQYYLNYGADPIRDLELVVARCLRTVIFEDELRYHPEPNADNLRKLQDEGRVPRNLSPDAIIPVED